MSFSKFSTILLIGGTSGIGAGLAHRLHAEGKKVIVTGRRQDRLTAIERELPGTRTANFDLSDIHALPNTIANITQKFPDIDSVIIAAGIMYYTQLDKPETVDPESVSLEVATNLTGPLIVSNLFTSFFLSEKKKNSPTLIAFVTSGLAIAPGFPVASVYCATKSALHSFAISLRSLLRNSQVSVVEIGPQIVGDTELMRQKSGDQIIAALGGPESPAAKGMPLQQCLDEIMAGLSEGKEEFGPGRADALFKLWRSSFEPVLQQRGVMG